ncbi:MAG: sulfatase-like hydrolase/transferase [bacterium]|nr:sulfatase-like hydrolase/transferase [bacterium]MCP5069320.1 sulfatase-like hydrolase/transferase [bacterium]
MILALLLSLLAACTKQPSDPQSPRLVILYAPCTVSKAFLAPYGAEEWLTPNLARFAESAVIFGNHRTEAGSSGIAYAALFSGGHADRHGVFQHPAAVGDAVDLIAEAYAERGYETYFWNGHGMTSNRLNYDQGVPPHRSFKRGLVAQDIQFQKLLEGLRSDPERRAFVTTTFTVTHGPYSQDYLAPYLALHPEERPESTADELARWIRVYRDDHIAFAYNFEETLKRRGIPPSATPGFIETVELLYKTNIAHLDQMFGELLKTLDNHGIRDESLIAFTADHGEIMFRDNALFKWTHSSSLAPEVLEVPLLISAPGAGVAPGPYAAVTRSIDVFPTLLGLSGLPVPESDSVEGLDLTPVLTGQQPPPDLLAYSHLAAIPRVVHRRMRAEGQALWGQRKVFFPTPDIGLIWASVKRGQRVFKYRDLGGHWGFQAYDLEADPGETTDLFDPNDPSHQLMAENLLRYKSRLVERARAQRRPRGVGPAAHTESKDEAALKSLGYIR